MLIVTTAFSALLQLLLIGGVPCLLYYIFQRIRHGRTFREVAARLGLNMGRPELLPYAAGIAVAFSVALVAGSRWLEALIRDGLAQRQFVGVGITMESVVAAVLYGGVQTGLTEELLFRGLIAGGLARRLPLIWANVLQALVFSLIHLPIVLIAPELWGMLIAVFAIALVLGWMRLRSDSILGPWLIHAAVNVTTALIAAAYVA